MPSIRQKSKPAISTLVLPALLVAAMAMPAAGFAAPPEPTEPPQLAFDPASHDFGLQQVNNGGPQANLQLRNNGAEAVQVNSVEIPGGSEYFWFNTNCNGAWLQPNETCSVQAYFNPRDAIEYAAQLRASSGSYSFYAALTGTGGRAILAPASNPSDFGTAAVGSAGVTREIAISNVGNIPGGAFIAVIAGGAVGSFQLLDENCTGHMLAAAATCTLQVRFRPISEGVKTATLGLFGDNDGGTQVVLTGVGSAPDPVVEPSQPPSPDAEVAPAAADAPQAPVATPRQRAKPHKGKRFPRRHRRANLHAARRVLRADAERTLPLR